MTKDEIIETKAAWGKTFVEIIDPTKENHVFRAYFEQPQRTWVGLTDKDVNEIYTSVQLEVNEHWDKGGTTMMFPLTLYKAIEAKLKEGNSV
jgi:hypothetical protein